MKKQDFRDLFDEDSEIKIFYGNWGHKLPRYNDNGCWSWVYLNKKGNLEYRAGYKWMPTGPSFPIDNKAIRKLTHNYLDSF